MISNIPETTRMDSDRSSEATDDANWVRRINNPLKSSMVHDNSELLNRPSKLVKLDDGRSMPLSLAGFSGHTASGSGPTQVFGTGSLPVNQISKAQNQQSEQQVSQVICSVFLFLIRKVQSFNSKY